MKNMVKFWCLKIMQFNVNNFRKKKKPQNDFELKKTKECRSPVNYNSLIQLLFFPVKFIIFEDTKQLKWVVGVFPFQK